MAQQQIKIILLAVVLGIALCLTMHFDLLRKIGFVQCEGFSCTYAAIVYFEIGGMIPLALMLGAALVCRQNRAGAAATGFIAGALCVGLALGAVIILNKIKISHNVCAAIKQCEDGDERYQRACEWELSPEARQQYPQCFE